MRSNYRQASTYTLTKATGSRVRAKDLRSDLAGFHKKAGSWFRVWAGICGNGPTRKQQPPGWYLLQSFRRKRPRKPD